MLEWIELSPVATFLRRSIWAYPLVNALHILGLGALVTSALVMDFRILGVGRRLSVEGVTGLLRPVAFGAAALAILTGALLFSVKPHEYAGNPVFLTKIALLGLALVNAAVFVLTARHERPGETLTRLMVVVSILLWLSVLGAGRLIAFFD